MRFLASIFGAMAILISFSNALACDDGEQCQDIFPVLMWVCDEDSGGPHVCDEADTEYFHIDDLFYRRTVGNTDIYYINDVYFLDNIEGIGVRFYVDDSHIEWHIRYSQYKDGVDWEMAYGPVDAENPWVQKESRSPDGVDYTSNRRVWRTRFSTVSGSHARYVEIRTDSFWFF